MAAGLCHCVWNNVRDIQEAAGIALTCHEQHEHSDACSYYGFHDLRRGFASENAEALGTALQASMRHKSYATTQLYINMARHVRRTTEKLSVPPCLKGDSGEDSRTAVA